jgi:hypothetical protein
MKFARKHKTAPQLLRVLFEVDVNEGGVVRAIVNETLRAKQDALPDSVLEYTFVWNHPPISRDFGMDPQSHTHEESRPPLLHLEHSDNPLGYLAMLISDSAGCSRHFLARSSVPREFEIAQSSNVPQLTLLILLTDHSRRWNVE